MLKHVASFKAEMILVLVTIIAAFGWIFSKEALAGLPPLFFMGIRLFFAAVVLFLVGRKYFKKVSLRDIRQASIVGVMMGISMMFWVTGLDLGSNLGVGAFISSLGVVFVPVVARFMFNQRSPVSIWLALPIAVIGLGFLALDNGLEFETSHFFFLGAALSSAFQFNLLSRSSLRMHPLVLTTVQLGISGVLLLVVSVMTEPIPRTISLNIMGWLLASILLATCVRFLLQTYGMSMTQVSHAAVIMNLEPVWTAVLGVIWFRESMGRWQLLGCFLIFIAMLVSRLPQIKSIFKSREK